MREHRITSSIELHVSAIKRETAINSLANLVNYLEHILAYTPLTTLLTNTADPQPSPDHDTTYKSTSKNKKSKKNRNNKQHVTHESTTCTCTLADCLTCTGENVINLFGTPLDQSQVALLSKGLSFIPASADLETKKNTGNQFITEMRLK